MCSICGHYPCHPQCPNAPDPEAVYECASCKEPIRGGDDYFGFDGDYYHEDCFLDNAPSILVEKCGAVRGIANARCR